MDAKAVTRFFKTFSTEVFDHSWLTNFHSIDFKVIKNDEFYIIVNLWNDAVISREDFVADFEDFAEAFLGEFKEFDFLLTNVELETEDHCVIGKLYFK